MSTGDYVQIHSETLHRDAAPCDPMTRTRATSRIGASNHGDNLVTQPRPRRPALSARSRPTPTPTSSPSPSPTAASPTSAANGHGWQRQVQASISCVQQLCRCHSRRQHHQPIDAASSRAAVPCSSESARSRDRILIDFENPLPSDLTAGKRSPIFTLRPNVTDYLSIVESSKGLAKRWI